MRVDRNTLSAGRRDEVSEGEGRRREECSSVGGVSDRYAGQVDGSEGGAKVWRERRGTGGQSCDLKRYFPHSLSLPLCSSSMLAISTLIPTRTRRICTFPLIPDWSPPLYVATCPHVILHPRHLPIACLEILSPCRRLPVSSRVFLE